MELGTVQEKLYALRVQYVSQLVGKVVEFHLDWLDICHASGNMDVRPEFYRQIHNLHGTAGTYGCIEVAEVAAVIENLIKPHSVNHKNIDLEVQNLITGFLHALTIAAKTCELRGTNAHIYDVHHADIAVTHLSGKPLLYIVDDDFYFLRALTEMLSEKYECQSCVSVEEFNQAVSIRLPNVVVMDMMLPEGDQAGAEATLNFTREHKVPVIFASVCDDEASRLAAIRAGAASYFVKQDNHLGICALLDSLVTPIPSPAYRVLMIDDDADLTALYLLKLQSAGIETRVLNVSVGVIPVVKNFMPDIIVLDIGMPDINGLELGALIRQYAEFNHIPILYLSAETSDSVHLSALQLGGDEFLHKPVKPDYLTQFLLARLARVRVTRLGEYRLQEALSELTCIQDGLNKHALVSIADVAGRMTYANEKFTEISGYANDELIGQNHRVVKSGMHPPEFYQEMWTTINSGKSWFGEIINRRRNGQLYVVLTTIIPMLDEYGLPKRYLSIRTDITPVRHLNEELRKESSRLSVSLEATSTGLWEWNLNINESLTDRNWCKLLGYDYPTYNSWSMMVHPDDHEEAFLKLLALLDDKSNVYQSEHRKLNAAGGWDWVLESGKVFEVNAEGYPVRIVGTMQIINERKAAEARTLELREQLSQAAKMESVGHLTAGIAHDFNNILGAMLGYAELSEILLSNSTTLPVEKLKRYLNVIKTSGTRAKELIAQMLTFSRLSPVGMDEGQPPMIMLTPIVKEVVALLRSSIPSTVGLNYKIDTVELKARIQPVHLHQIMLNLGINARDASGEYGHIEISLSEYQADNHLCNSCKNRFEGRYAQIKVKDSGSGMPDHILSKIFDPFFTTKGVGKGTGMGLAVVHGLVHGLGGHILVESTLGEGATFSILLPLDGNETDEQETAADAMAVSIKNARIMVVDDEQGMATMLHEFLSVYGAHVASFVDPKQALEAFSGLPGSIDLVITDETMPGMTGSHLAEKILKLRPGTPIVLCTGFSKVATPETAAKIGIAAYFDKPLKLNELLQTIHKLLQDKK